MNLDRILQPGTRIELVFDGQDGQEMVWDGRVCAKRPDSFLVRAPEHIEQVISQPVGLGVMVCAGLDNARCCFDSLILREVRDESGILLELQKPQKLTVADRRNFVRMESRLPVRFGIVKPEEIGQWREIEPQAQANLVDLSGVGLSFIYTQPIPTGTRVVLELLLEMKSAAVTIRLLGTVTRTEEYGGSVRIGVRFDNASEAQQDLIMKHLFHNMRRQFQIQRED